jgi:hypothetical protein
MASTSWLLVIRWLFCNPCGLQMRMNRGLCSVQGTARSWGAPTPLARLIDASPGDFAVEGFCATAMNGVARQFISLWDRLIADDCVEFAATAKIPQGPSKSYCVCVTIHPSIFLALYTTSSTSRGQKRGICRVSLGCPYLDESQEPKHRRPALGK